MAQVSGFPAVSISGSCGRDYPVKLERCRSGRTGTTGNRVGEQSSRGFESRPLRHILCLRCFGSRK